MLRIYCRARHGRTEGLCEACDALRRYAGQRLDNCPFAEQKPACNRCQVHCYGKARRAQVRQVMRFAGPRMLLRHPFLAVRHLLDERRPVPALTLRKSDLSKELRRA